MDLKIKDVADLLNVSETTIRRWLGEGKIPAYKINHQYRFSRFEIEDWVMGQKLSASNGPSSFNGHLRASVKTTERTDDSGNHVGRKQFSLYRAIHKGGVYGDILGNTKEQLIRSTMKRIASEMNVDAEVVSELLLGREHLQSTALSNGVAVPHTRDCILEANNNVVTVVFPKKPIVYDALDGEPIHTLFFLFAGEDKCHLHLLAKIAHLSSRAETVNFLRTKPAKNELLDYIKNWESSITRAL